MPKNLFGEDIAKIVHDQCIGCQLCVNECPVNAISVLEDGTAKIDPEACIGCGACFKACPARAILFEAALAKGAAAAQPPPLPHRGVAVFIETRDHTGAGVSWELVGKARELAARLETRVIGFLVGHEVGPVAREAIAYGCDAVYTIDHPLLKDYLSSTYGNCLAHLAGEVRPEILLVGATALGRDLAGIAATRLNTGLTADCTGLDVDVQERVLLMTRPTFGGSVLCTIMCRKNRPQMSTVRPGVMKMPVRDSSRLGEIKKLDFLPPAEGLPRIVEFIARTGEEAAVDIAKAGVLVVIGRGACRAEDLDMFHHLAGLLGGVVACSRPVVEAGLLPYVRQVGQTGKTVAPKIYLGIAVSGAVQHLVGMQNAGTIAAINIDPRAPMMEMADYALVGDYREIVPRLIQEIKARKAQALRR